MTPQIRLSQGEFIALMAMVFATIAFSIDAMLPALPLIGAELSPDDLNRAQLLVTSFVLGMGLGTFLTGPLSDAYGRKPIMMLGCGVYLLGTLAAFMSEGLTLMLVARVLMGLGAAGPRVVVMAIIRDLYVGREMAKITSFVFLVFAIAPALAPSLGYLIMAAFGWRAIFLSFAIFIAIAATWLMLRQPETLPKQSRRPLKITALVAATRETFSHRTVVLSTCAQTLTLGVLFSVISSIQQVFDITFDQGAHFHLWFGAIALVAASASWLNARLVERIGMRPIIRTMYMVQIGITIFMIGATLAELPYTFAFGAYLIWVVGNFFLAGMTLGNLNALAMEDMGHIAGMAASLIAGVSTVGAVLLAAPIALLFDGTPLPIAIGVLVLCSLALWITTLIRRSDDEVSAP